MIGTVLDQPCPISTDIKSVLACGRQEGDVTGLHNHKTVIDDYLFRKKVGAY